MDGGSRLREREEGEECAEGGGEGAMELVFSKDVIFAPWEVGEVAGKEGREGGRGGREGGGGRKEGGREEGELQSQFHISCKEL